MSDQVLKLQHELLTNEKARELFARDPAGYLRSNGIELSENVRIPEKLDLDILNTRLEIARNRLASRGLHLMEDGRLVVESATAANRVLSDVFAPEISNFEEVAKRVENFRSDKLAREATIAVMAAVVEVVVVP